MNAGDFPFHKLQNPTDRNSGVLFDTDDLLSSQGTFSANFIDITPGKAEDKCTIVSPDPLAFHLNNINVRRVEPRNTPTVINAVFNHRNFWDGRANNIFNGVNNSGLADANARILEAQGASVVKVKVAFGSSSLASQAVTPTNNDLEMSCFGRVFPKVGKKLLSLKPLAQQRVHRQDSALGALSNWPNQGLKTGNTYATLIQAAFADRLWQSTVLVNQALDPIGTGAPANTSQYTQMEANFSLFWGLAIQAYERTLVSNDAPYDKWAEAPGGRDPTVANAKGILTAAQMRGMELFFGNTPGARGSCGTCHQGSAFTTAAFPFTEEGDSGEFPEKEQPIERMRMGDGVNIAENLFTFFIKGQGAVGGINLSGTAGSRRLPSIYPWAVGGDLTVNGAQCTVQSFLMNQDRVANAPVPGSGAPGARIPPEPPGPSAYADYSTRDAVVRVSGCSAPYPLLEITIVDNGTTDTATIRGVLFAGLPAQFPSGYPIPPTYAPGPPLASGAVTGDFKLNGPTLYDAGFYNIGVRPFAEDLGVGETNLFGAPLSFTKQWINQLQGTPAPNSDSIKNQNFSRTAVPFNWYGDSVFFPGGMNGYGWLTHKLVNTTGYPGGRCQEPGFGGAPLPQYPDQASCQAAGKSWVLLSEFTLFPQFGPPKLGRGDDAVPLYAPPFSTANLSAIQNMATAVDGAFKTPGLRNVSLTAPYFHTGGQLTLQQVVDFYNRGSDFGLQNLGKLSPNIHPLVLDPVQRDDLVAFLGALTDERVTCEKAPFDHPEIRIANGARGGGGFVTPDNKKKGQSKDQIELIQATGAGGRQADSAPCIDQENFLN
jgi:cytochrome c peroxidase